MLRFLILLSLIVFVLSGCSGIFPYKNHLQKNLTVKTRTDSGSFFTSVKARVDIYAVDKSCKLTYQGSVDLEESEVEVGLSQNSPVYLDFIFSSSSFFANSKGSTGFDLYFKTRHGYKYIAEASYAEGIYDVILKEKKQGSKKLLELPYGECKPR